MKRLETFLQSVIFKLPWNRGYNCYSQFGEQLVIQNILSRVKFSSDFADAYIDIGAYHPIKDSNTLMLYRHGFRGVAVDPNPLKAAEFKRYRPDDFFICKAVVPQSWECQDVVMKASSNYDGRESISSAFTRGVALENSSLSYRAGTIKLPNVVDECLKKFGKPKLLSIDIEGLESEILQEFSFDQCLAPVLCVEHIVPSVASKSLSLLNYQHSSLVQHLERNGYFLTSVCAISLIFVHKEFWRPYD